MRDQFYTILTNIGKAKIANATALNDKISFTKLVVGDGNGNYYEPTEDQIKLKNQVWEGGIGNIQIDKDNPNWIVIETVIPSNVGGFTIREVGVKDIDDNLIVISKYPETYKPKIEDGSTKDLIIKLILEISNAECVTLKVDPTIILATHKDLENIKNELDNKISNIDVSNIERKNYSELKELKDNKKLKQGSYYILIDYKTKYIQPDTNALKECDTEELILLVTSENTFSAQVYSIKYPKDIIYYDFDNNKCEDGKTPRNGFITRRHDTNTGNSCPYDFRHMLWARWCPDENQYYKDDKLVDYEVWTEGEVKLDVLYKAGNQLLLAKESGTPESATDSNYFVPVYTNVEIGCLINEKTKTFNRGIEIKKGEVQERLTFGENCINNTFGGNCVNNVLGDDCKNNTFGHSCHSNTFEENCTHNIVGNTCTSNLFESGCSCNIFGNNCDRNIFNMKCSYNDFGNNCDDNVFGERCSSNVFFNTGTNNVFGYNCHNNTLGSECFRHTFKGNCSYNSFGNDVRNIGFGNECKSNHFGDDCYFIYMGEYCQGNTFGNTCTQITFGNDCKHNTFDSYCYDNEFGEDCGHNYFKNSCHDNIFGEFCIYNSFDVSCYRNKFGDQCSRNHFQNSCYDNVLQGGCRSNLLNNECYGNNFGTNCCNNTLSPNCHRNIFGVSCDDNYLGSSCYANTFGTYCDDNYLGSSCSANTFGDICKNLVVKKLYNKDISNVGVHGVTFTINIEQNSDGNYVYWLLNENNTPVYKQIP